MAKGFRWVVLVAALGVGNACRGSECEESMDCSLGEQCSNGYCETPPCSSPLDCAATEYCNAERECAAKCRGNWDCDAGYCSGSGACLTN